MKETILVTGATGLVGGGVLQRMLRTNPTLAAYVLVRDEGGWRRELPRWGRLAFRITAVGGDISLPGGGRRHIGAAHPDAAAVLDLEAVAVAVRGERDLGVRLLRGTGSTISRVVPSRSCQASSSGDSASARPRERVVKMYLVRSGLTQDKRALVVLPS